jgi:hypothetical protein
VFRRNFLPDFLPGFLHRCQGFWTVAEMRRQNNPIGDAVAFGVPLYNPLFGDEVVVFVACV